MERMPPTVEQRLKAIHHVVHEYANFVSSGEMMTTGEHMGVKLKPPINTHVAHAFLLNSRKLADFFCGCADKDDVVAGHYVSTTTFDLPVFGTWRNPLNTQLAHISYKRDKTPKVIRGATQLALYKELKTAWKEFYAHLPEPYKSAFDTEIENKLATEFRGLNLR